MPCPMNYKPEQDSSQANTACSILGFSQGPFYPSFHGGCIEDILGDRLTRCVKIHKASIFCNKDTVVPDLSVGSYPLLNYSTGFHPDYLPCCGASTTDSDQHNHYRICCCLVLASLSKKAPVRSASCFVYLIRKIRRHHIALKSLNCSLILSPFNPTLVVPRRSPNYASYPPRH